MNLHRLLTVLLVVGVALPVAAASAFPAPSSPAASSPSTAASPSAGPSHSAASSPSASQAAGGATATASPSDGGSSARDGNYTRLYVDDRYRHLRLKPGENDTVTVVVANGEDEPVPVSPHLVRPKVGGRPLEPGWVSIDAPTTTIDPGEEIEVTVSVAVPEAASLGDVRGWIAFTNETIAAPGRPPQPIHATTLSVEVWREPTVRVLSGRHMHAQIEAGEGTTHSIVVENTGDEAVPLSPDLATDRRGTCYGNCPVTVERSWLEIDAPSEIAPGETETVNVTVTPPEDAERGRYDAEVDLGIRDPARDERDTHWQEIDLNFQVWTQPDEPFRTDVAVSEDATNLTLELSPRTNRYPGDGAGDAEPVRFDVTLHTPGGEEIQPERVRVTDSGFVDLSGDRSDTSPGDYAVRGGGTQFVYRVSDPAAGTWTVEIMPHNTIGFGYEVVREEANDP